MTELEFLQAQEEAQKRLNEKNRQFGLKGSGSPLKQSPFSSSFINQLDKTELEKLKFLEAQSQKWQNPDSMNARLNEQFQSLQNKPMNEYYTNNYGSRNSFMVRRRTLIGFLIQNIPNRNLLILFSFIVRILDR